MARLLALNVGLPRDVAWNGKTVRTAIWKFPVDERRMARKLNIDGDAQADLAGHGGERRAVLFTRRIRIGTGSTSWGAMVSASDSSERISQLKDLAITRLHR